MMQKLIDWWRGYTSDEVWSLANKLNDAEGAPLGTWVPLTNGEMRALQDNRVIRISENKYLIAP